MKYIQETADKNGWSRWVKPRKRGYRMMCCDCGLVHEMDFDYERNKRGTFIFFRVKRSVRATASARRRKQVKS